MMFESRLRCLNFINLFFFGHLPFSREANRKLGLVRVRNRELTLRDLRREAAVRYMVVG